MYDYSLADYLSQPITNLSGISDKTKANLIKVCGETYYHLLFHLPIKTVHRECVDILDLEKHQHQIITFKAVIGKHYRPSSSKAPYRVTVHTMGEHGVIDVQLVFFRMLDDYIKKILPSNKEKIISGKLEVFDNRPQIIHPDYIIDTDKHNDLPQIQPIYALTAGLKHNLITKSITQILQNMPHSSEWIRSDLMEKYRWVSFKDSLQAIHFPKKIDDCDMQSPYRQRLAYDSILAHQLTLAISRATRQKHYAVPIQNNHEIAHQIIKNLPFTLTNDQKSVVNDIFADLQKPYQMSRLVQGDVGSGKTIIALLAASLVIQDKYQAAIMVPTEILARQHYQNLKPLCNAVGIRLGILTGKDKPSDVRITLEKLKSGQIDLIIGTHALIQTKVVYKNLALAIIDEQHRFGVLQREDLLNKANPKAHLLMMTATPIPRSLAMVHYGDCDISVIAEKPPLRQPIITRIMPIQKIQEITMSLQRVIQNAERVYWVCPLVEESEKMDLMAAEERFELLKNDYSNQVGLIHGKMKSAEKDSVITDFIIGKISILVSTTVIEVGVNVPEATIMIIEQAERFGLSQLHQLRGRVGRGNKQASCLLLYKTLNQTAIERLSMLRETEDGFLLAETDLRLRGAGDILGVKQTGVLNLPAFDFYEHKFLLKIARDDAEYILQMDSDFITSRGKSIKILQKIFDNSLGCVSKL